MSKIVKIYHYNSKLTKLADIMDFERIYGVNEVDFLNFKDERGVSNRQKAFDINQKQYVNIDKIESAEQLDANSTFYSPIIFALPSEYVSTEILISESTLQIPNDDYEAFLSLEILKIINSPSYKDKYVN